MKRRDPLRWPVAAGLIIALTSGGLTGGCGYLRQISEEGGLWAKVQAQREPAPQSSEAAPSESPPPTSPPEGRKPSGQASAFSHHAQDQFFTLHWTYFRRGEQQLEARGIVENRNGPAMRSIVLELTALDESGRVIQRGHDGVRRPLSSREVRPFQIVIPLNGTEKTFGVSVASYEFLGPKDVR